MKFTKEMQDRIISWMEQNGSSFAGKRHNTARIPRLWGLSDKLYTFASKVR